VGWLIGKVCNAGLSTISPFHHNIMALNLKNARAEQLAHELAAATGESLTDVVIAALETQLRMLNRVAPSRMTAAVAQLQAFLGAQPDLDTRSAEAIIGYDAFGIPE